MGSYGVRRPKKGSTGFSAMKAKIEAETEEPVKPVKEKSPAKARAKAKKEEAPAVTEVITPIAEEPVKVGKKKTTSKASVKKEEPEPGETEA